MFSFFSRGKSVSSKEIPNDKPLIDVRSADEFKAGHVKGAINIPLEQIQTYNGKEKEIYVICASGARSARAVSVLEAKGYDASNVRGGMMMWSGEIEKGS